MSVGVVLLTKGKICLCPDCLVGRPQIMTAIEVRPRVRGVTYPAPVAIVPPTVTAAETMQPVVTGVQAPAPTTPTPTPPIPSTIELKPVIKDVKED